MPAKRNDSGFVETSPNLHANSNLENETFADIKKTAKESLEEEKKTHSIGKIVQSVLWSKVTTTKDVILVGGIRFGIAMLIWLLGYFNFSILWIFCAVCASVLFTEKLQRRFALAKISKDVADDSQKFVENMKLIYRSEKRHLPPWLFFPDMERAEWLNRILQQLWPNVGDFVKNLLTTKVEPSVQKSHALLASFTFADVELGDRAPRIAGVKVYDQSLTSKSEIVMDIQFVYDSECNLGVSINGLQAGIKDLQIRGLLRVVLQPLIPVVPIVGAVSISFLQDPQIDFNLTHLANLFDLPGIDDLLRGAIVDCIGEMMVMPESYIVKLAKDVDISKLKYPIPKGLIRIHVLEAKNLEEKDRKILGMGGGSDPFVKIKVGHHRTYQTAVISHNINPVWNETFDYLVVDVTMTQIQFLLYDDDGVLNKADFLGSASLPIRDVFEYGLIDEWITLSDVTTGSLHVRLQWYDLTADESNLPNMLALKEDTSFLNVYIEGACLNQNNTQENFDPSPMVKVCLTGKEPISTRVVQDTSNPVWEENVRCLLQNPYKDILKLMVENDGKGSLGNYELKVADLLKKPDLTLDEPLYLKDAENSVLNARITLRILKAKPKKEGLDASKAITVHKTTGKHQESANVVTTKEKELESDVSTSPSMKMDFEGSSTSSLGKSSLPRTPSISSEMSIPGAALTNLRRRQNAKMNEKSSSSEEINDSGLGRLQLTIRHTNKQLVVIVVKAERLIVCDDDDNTSDPYVRVHLNGDKKNRKKTKVIKNNLNPVFDQKLTFDVSLKDASRSKLHAVVKNQTGFLSSEKSLMGQVTIDLSDIDLSQPTTSWYALQIEEES